VLYLNDYSTALKTGRIGLEPVLVVTLKTLKCFRKTK